MRAGGCFYDVAGSNDGDARHRCTSISVSTQGGGLADTGGKEHILFEIKEELDAKCAWLAFFGDDYRSHESLIGQSLCWHANGEMKKLRPFVSRRSELDNADLLDAYRELDYLDSEEGGAVPMHASDGENEGEDGGGEASDDEPMPPSLDALQSAKCCMHELGYSGCKRGGNKGQKKYFLDHDGLDGNCIIGEGAISAALVNAIGTLLRGALHRELTATTELLVGIKDFRPDVPPATYVLCVSDGGAESWSVVLDVPMDGDTIVSLPCDHGGGGRGTATIDADSMETDEAALETIVLSAHSIEIPLSVWQEYVSGSLALVRLMVHAKTNGELMEDTCSRGHAPNVKCPYCSVDARQMGMLGMDVDPPLEEGRLWELDRRTHAKEAIFSIIDKLVDIAIADGESYDCVNGEVIRADLVSKVSADWFSNALGEDAADDIQMQVTRLDAAVLQWMQEQVKGSTGKPSKSEKLTYLWPKIVRSWSTSGGGGRITVLQRVTARFMTTDGKTIAPSKSGHTIIASAMQRHCIACRHCVVDLR